MIKLKSCRILRYLSRVSLYIGVAKLFTVIFVLVCRNLSNLRAEFLKPVLAIIETSRTPIFSCFCPPTTWSAHCYGKLAATHPSRKNPDTGPRPQTLLGSRQACRGLSVACPKPASSLRPRAPPANVRAGRSLAQKAFSTGFRRQR